jgi:tetratricopeptide (TPR) repeat protein
MSKNKAVVNQALALKRSRRFQQAEQLLRKAHSAHPDDTEALFNLALLKAEIGDFSEAHYLVTMALNADPGAVRLHVLMGDIQMQTGSPEAALASYVHALATQPGDAKALFGKGFALQRLGRLEDALENYAAALVMEPGQAELWCNHGNVLNAIGRLDAALESFDRALLLRPDVSLVHFNRANVLNALGRTSEALAAYDRAIALAPANADFFNNRGNVRLEAGDAAGSIKDFQQLLTVSPNDARAYNGLGMALQDQGRFGPAIEKYSRALDLAPTYADASHNLALAHLYLRQFSEAWPKYERRRDHESYRANLRRITSSVDMFDRLPLWQGPRVKLVQPVGIWCEQGLGDQVLFSTIIPELVETGHPFVFEVDARLRPAYQRVFPQVQFVALADPPSAVLTTAGAALFCGSLPRFFRPSVDSFSRQPQQILQAAPERVAYYRSCIGSGFKLALSWRSARTGRLGRDKSANLADFAPLLALPGVRGVDIQYGNTVAERDALLQTHGLQIEHIEGIDYYNDLDEVLAIIEACDLLITTSNANAHLAAALGKPVWLLYPSERAPFHYWAHTGDHRCLWYPSVEIISGPELEDWSRLFEVASERLRRLVAEKAV